MQMFADLYHSMAPHGFTPRDVDGMEVWEAASVLGMHRPAAASATGSGQGRDLVAERLAFAAGRGPQPKPDAAPVDGQVIDMFRIRQQRKA